MSVHNVINITSQSETQSVIVFIQRVVQHLT